ncbi:expressed unknown protein [Seminavis robusta]|uniref:Uncharacterized protein n=1 Tax=Seminavis robusta TaxID=568900 RepID=A0A9N8DSC0_9STRA|nr:expressed unknown protein [Seminavis robusta]|eukprot:Sro247_g097990.1 n/a (119) ;mRNA; r:16544-16900
MVYIAEAHAMDEWPVTSGRFNKTGPVLIEKQPTLAAERCQLARQFAKHFDMMDATNKTVVELLVDDPEQGDPFETAYAPWPLRLYLVDAHGKLEWIAQPKDCSYEEAVVQLLGLLGSN